MMDTLDFKIIECLKRNSRMTWKEIGEQVHLTGQAVSARVRALEELGVIRSYTVDLDEAKLGPSLLGLVTIFMADNNHTDFLRFLHENSGTIREAHRISGNGCYWLKIIVSNQNELDRFLEGILSYGNYQLNLSVSQLV